MLHEQFLAMDRQKRGPGTQGSPKWIDGGLTQWLGLMAMW